HVVVIGMDFDGCIKFICSLLCLNCALLHGGSCNFHGCSGLLLSSFCRSACRNSGLFNCLSSLRCCFLHCLVSCLCRSFDILSCLFFFVFSTSRNRKGYGQCERDSYNDFKVPAGSL